MNQIFTGLLLAAVITSCSESPTEPVISPSLDEIATDYLFLELSMGLHDEGHVDAYFGPQQIKDLADREQIALGDIKNRALTMRETLLAWDDASSPAARVQGLVARLTALLARIAINQGENFSFDEEALRLFGTSAPNFDAAHFDAILADIDELIPGEGELAERVIEFESKFIIPAEKLPVVFSAAIAECRRRTLEHIALPEHESFRVEYVNDKPWTGYNWYQGDARSLIQVNTDLPISIDYAVDLGCHEGYPGHHVFNALLEENLVNNVGWMEFTIYPLFSPQSLIAEGSGNYGVELAFPGEEQIQFERSVLFPLAALDDSQAGLYYQYLELRDRLNYAGNEAARDYLNGVIDRDEAIEWLIKYQLYTRERATQRTTFFDAYRSYVINYNHGKALVEQYIERDTDDADERWERFEQMLSTPTLPQDLK